ncbi:MAG: hypothetical protein PHQ11_07195, partial [Paludibacter sp.]|nr:hypothetical protein [Paludibacter sp.]
MKLIIGEHTIDIQKETLSILKSWAEKPWHWEIYHFLEQWFDRTKYIELNTSGSTGDPKKIKLRKEAMMCSAMMTNKFFRMHQESISLLCLPASYIAGKMMLVRAIAGNYTLIAVEPA